MSALAWQKSGKGFPLVLVHGYLAGADIWRDQIAHFAGKFEVFAPNLPGFGDSSHLEMPNSITEIARDLLSDLRNFSVDRFHLIGHSMGGMIAQAMAALAPERVSHLVCYGTGPVGVLPDRFETIDQSRQRLKNDGLESTVRRIAATWFLKGEQDKEYPRCVTMGLKATMHAALASLSAWENWDGRDRLKDIRAKTLVVWGDNDHSYGWRQPEALWRGIRGSSLAVLPQCAHNVHMEKAALFNAIVEDFLPANP